MVEFVGLKNSNFDPQKLERIVEDNCGAHTTTERLAASVDRVSSLFGDRFAAGMEAAGLVLRER